jgi:hypothetical protein
MEGILRWTNLQCKEIQFFYLCQQAGSLKGKVKKIRRKREMMEGTMAGLALHCLVALII